MSQRRRKKRRRKKKKKRGNTASATGLVETPQPTPLEEADKNARSLMKTLLQTLFAVSSTYVITLVSFYLSDDPPVGENPGAGFLEDGVVAGVGYRRC